MVENDRKKEDKAVLTNPQLLFKSRMGPLGRLDPAFPGVMLQAATAFPDLCQPGQKEAHSWQALSAIHLEKRQVLSSDLIGNRQSPPNCAL